MQEKTLNVYDSKIEIGFSDHLSVRRYCKGG